MNTQLTPKQSLLLNRLKSQIAKLSKAMHNEGFDGTYIHRFVMENVFEETVGQKQGTKKWSEDLNSETQEQTNSETSAAQTGQNRQITLENGIAKLMKEGKKLGKIILQYAEKCSIAEQKFKSYLEQQDTSKEQPQKLNPSQATIEFTKFQQRISQQKFNPKPYISQFDDLAPNYTPSLARLTSINSRYMQSQMNQMKQSQQQLQYIKSFQQSLSESIKKTRMLRNMLEKQIFTELRRKSSVEQDQEGLIGEIY